MKRRLAVGAIVIIPLLVIIGVVVVLVSSHAAILNPKGMVASRERGLLIFATLLSMLVVIPVFAMTLGIAWKYRETNPKARYTPEWDHSRLAETIWWAIPSALIGILAIIIWQSSHELDPAQVLASSTPPITIQVVALDWKWLFIYPEQQIASVNFVQFPQGTPVNFEVTSDAPMNSLWIPQLGGQIYAMPGMTTHLHLLADTTGDFAGSSANISGRGFARMRFVARASDRLAFDQWVAEVRNTGKALDRTSYQALAEPSTNTAVTSYTLRDHSLYDETVMKYMMPGVDTTVSSQ